MSQTYDNPLAEDLGYLHNLANGGDKMARALLSHFNSQARHERFSAPAAADLVSVVADVSLSNVALTIAAQPDVPRKLQVHITDGDSSITAGTATVVGTTTSGESVTEIIPLAGGTRTVKTAYAYAHVASITVAALAGNAGADHISAGLAPDLGLVLFGVPGGTLASVHKENVDGVDEAVGTVDLAAGTISPTTAPNATHNYDFWYTVKPKTA